jgi:hypothetical protein
VNDRGQKTASSQKRWLRPAVGFALIAALIFIVATIWLVVGSTAVVAATVALACCGAGVLAGWIASSLFLPRQVLERLGVAMILRMFVPLCLFLVLYVTSPSLVAAGLAYFVIAIYLCLLAAETYMAVRRLEPLRTTRGNS